MKFKSIAAALAVMFFCQCQQAPASDQDNRTDNRAPVPTTGLKIAVVNVDSLLQSYNFCLDLNEGLMRKEENYRLVLTEEANKLEKEYNDFRKKIQNNVYSSEERAASEQNRLDKKAQAIQEKQAKYSQELELENAANAQKISDAIDAFLKEYNKEHGYDMIVSKAALLYSDDAMDITADIIKGLNAEYKSAEE